VAKGLYLIGDGYVVVDYGRRRVPISPAQYRANGYMSPYYKHLAHQWLVRAPPYAISPPTDVSSRFCSGGGEPL
jgi:hypothetical protein